MWSRFRDYNYAVHRLFAKAARRHLGRFSGRVVDVGCGTSPYRALLPDGVRYVGVDRGDGADVRADAAALPFADAVFDGALCTEVLELARRPDAVVAELARVLRPGAPLYLTAPFNWHTFDAHDYFRFTTHGLSALVEEGGFRVEHVERIGGPFSAAAGQLLEGVVQDAWLPLARAAGLSRGAYALAALAALPWNLVAPALTPLDKLGARSPLAVAVVAVRA